jgi:RNA polymerase sigma factor (sigma-70 family)
MQSALKSFLVRASAGQFRIENSQDIWRLLVTITVRKARQQVRAHHAIGRAVDREVPQPLEGKPSIVDQLTEEPSVAEALACAEILEQLVQGDPPEYARVLELRLADYSLREIAAELQLTKSTVESILNVLKSRLQRRWTQLSGGGEKA